MNEYGIADFRVEIEWSPQREAFVLVDSGDTLDDLGDMILSEVIAADTSPRFVLAFLLKIHWAREKQPPDLEKRSHRLHSMWIEYPCGCRLLVKSKALMNLASLTFEEAIDVHIRDCEPDLG